jgi:hypothetical protein
MRFSGMLEPPNFGSACSVAFVPQRARSRYASPLVFAKACELGLEGIVSKRAGSRYSEVVQEKPYLQHIAQKHDRVLIVTADQALDRSCHAVEQTNAQQLDCEFVVSGLGVDFCEVFDRGQRQLSDARLAKGEHQRWFFST